MSERHIIAIGGLLADGDNRPLVDYALKLCKTPRPHVGFIPTASGDAEAYRQRFDELAGGLNCEASTLRLFDRTPDVAEWVAAQDVILVGGGNTKSMLAVWREWGLPSLLWEAWEQGTALMGWSAGAICWFEQGVTDSCADRLGALDCLGFLPGSCCPHYDGEADRQPEFHRLLREQSIAPGVAIDDGAGVHFIGQQPHAVVRLTESTGACVVAFDGNAIAESALSIDHLVLT